MVLHLHLRRLVAVMVLLLVVRLPVAGRPRSVAVEVVVSPVAPASSSAASSAVVPPVVPAPSAAPAPVTSVVLLLLLVLVVVVAASAVLLLVVVMLLLLLLVVVLLVLLVAVSQGGIIELVLARGPAIGAGSRLRHPARATLVAGVSAAAAATTTSCAVVEGIHGGHLAGEVVAHGAAELAAILLI